MTIERLFRAELGDLKLEESARQNFNAIGNPLVHQKSSHTLKKLSKQQKLSKQPVMTTIK